MKPALTARLRVEETPSLFARVFIWPTKEAMYEHLPINRDHLGSCTPILRQFISDRGVVTRTDPCFAEVNLHVGALGSTVVGHELFHAALAWGRRRRLSLTENIDQSEERLSHAFSDMVGQLVGRLWAGGFYE